MKNQIPSDFPIMWALKDRIGRPVWKVSQIAKVYGRSVGTIFRWRSVLRLPSRERGRYVMDRPSRRSAAMVSMRRSGLTFAVIARRMGCTRQNVQLVVKRWGER